MRKRYLIFTVITIVLVVITAGMTIQKEGYIEKWQPPEQGKYADTLKVAASRDFEPMSFVDEEGNPAGYDVELIYAIGEKLGKNVEIHMLDWKDALAGIQQGKYDVLLSVTQSPMRADWLDYSSVVMVEPYIVFGYGVNNFGISELYHARIGLVRDDIVRSALSGLISLDNSFCYYDSYEDCFEAIMVGACDYVIAPQSFGLCIVDDMKLVGLEYSKTSLYTSVQSIAVQEGNSQLLSEINNALCLLRDEGQLENIYQRWMVDYVGLERPSTFIRENFLMFVMAALIILFAFCAVVLYFEYSRGKQIVQQAEDQKKLSALRTQLEVALRGISGGFFITGNDEKKSFVYVGESFAALMGYTVDELLERCHGCAADMIDAEDFTDYADTITEAVNADAFYSAKFRVKCKDGSTKWISSNGRIVINENGESECYSFNYDITEQELANKQLEKTAVLLRQEQQMYRGALLHDCEYAYTVEVYNNKIHSVYNAGFLEKYGFFIDRPYDSAMQDVVDAMRPVILMGAKEFHLTSHYISAYEQGKRMVDVEYYIPTEDMYKRKTIFLSKDEETGDMYACVVAYDITATRKKELEIQKALTKLTQMAVKAREGDLDVDIDVDAPGDVGVLAEVLSETFANLKWHMQMLNQKATHDALTGVKNKTAWDEIQDRLNAEIKEGTAEFGIVVFDVNGLKQVNDSMGHEAGDELLCEACRYICEVFLHSPIYRIGGDEFVAVLEGKDLKRASELIDEFVAGIVSGKKTTTREIKISTAIGMALYQKGKDLSCENVFVRADANMYQNKIAMKAKGF